MAEKKYIYFSFFLQWEIWGGLISTHTIFKVRAYYILQMLQINWRTKGLWTNNVTLKI